MNTPNPESALDPVAAAELAKHNTTPEATMLRVSERIKAKGRSAVAKNTVALETLKVEYVSITAIKPNSYNPNRHNPETFELLCRSMTEDGFTQPIVVRRQTMEIVDGEHRWRAGTALGYDEVPVVFVDMTDEQMKIATLRHNRARGSEDEDLSRAVLKDLQRLGAAEWAQHSLMMSDEEMSDLLDVVPAAEELAGESFSDAWKPDKEGDQKDIAASSKNGGSLVKEGNNNNGETFATALTPKAAEQVRALEAATSTATTDEQRAQVRAQIGTTYKVNAVFSNDEARLVRAALGDNPAAALLEECRLHLASQQPG